MHPIVFLIAFLSALPAFAQGTRADYDRALSLPKRTDNTIFRIKIEPHWIREGDAFWYRNDLPDGKREFILVDALKGTRQPIAESDLPPSPPIPVEKIPPSILNAEETSISFINRTEGTVRLFWSDRESKPVSYGELTPGTRFEQHTFVGHVWFVRDSAGKTLGVFTGRETGFEAIIAPREPSDDATPKTAPPADNERPWKASIREHNVWLKNRATGEEVRLSTDGTEANPYREPFRWSLDGSKLVALQATKAQERKVMLIESSPADQLQPKLSSYDYLKAGDRIAHPRPRLFDVGAGKPIAIKDELFPNPWSIDEIRWAPDGSRFTFLYNERGHRLMRVMSVDATSGEARTLVEERSATFIDYSQKTYLHWLDATNELIWASERDGWNHLWLYDSQTGAVKGQITRGEWVVRKVERVDAARRQVWFSAYGIRPGEDPYHAHLVRMNLDGTGRTILTEGDGTHSWQRSPNNRWLIDTWSRTDLPPTHELRNADTGAAVCPLEKADATALLATGWRMPQRFTAKGRDGKTDIYGIIIRPSNFDPAKKYPVIEQIYAGPHDYFVPKTFGRQSRTSAIAELGFIVVQIDGMGTNWRSRAFHDVAWKNLKDSGFPDRIAWLRAAATQHPEMDISRMGIYGGSAGGQSALGALLFFGDFYKAAVADCGCHDNRMDKIWWNEAWMGWPLGPEYADNSNVTHAGKLNGKLLLTVGELDRNVDPASTMQVVNALIKADKDFDLLVVPGSDHGAGERPYPARRRMDFFVRHLLGVEPRAK